MKTVVHVISGAIIKRAMTLDEIAAHPVITELDLQVAAREAFKMKRTEAVNQIVVEVDGLLFDGDEVAQGRIARSATAMHDNETITWVLANNTPAAVTKVQLIRALRLAGAAQEKLWMYKE